MEDEGAGLPADVGERIFGPFVSTKEITAVRDRAPDAVVLAVRLPDMTGLEAFDQIRAIDPRLPVVMITT